jgi:hypothetical protein
MPDVRSSIAAHGGLCSPSDLAARWGISPQRVRQLAEKPSFPEPVRTAGGSALYLADEADAWRREHELGVLERLHSPNAPGPGPRQRA